MKQMIIPKLHNLEKILAIEIFYTAEFGSHAEGFASKNSLFGGSSPAVKQLCNRPIWEEQQNYFAPAKKRKQ